jgi:hypothetical protein
LNIGSDGSGGTLITDPPAPSGLSVGVGEDHFFFHENPGANSPTANAQGNSNVHEPFTGMHAEGLSAIISALTPPDGGLADFAHHHADGTTIPGVSPSYLQQHLQNLVHLS